MEKTQRRLNRESAVMEVFKASSMAVEGRRISGRAVSYLSPIDTHEPTIMAPGCFRQSIRERGGRIKLLAHHDANRPIGRVVELKDGKDALRFVAELDAGVRDADELLAQAVTGTVDAVSVGFDVMHALQFKPEELLAYGAPDETVQRYLRDGVKSVRVVVSGRLWECSLVVWGADPKALIDRAGFRRVGFRTSEQERKDKAAKARLRVAAVDAVMRDLDLSAAVKGGAR